MGATSVTRSYTALITSVLDKVRKQVEDQISANNKLLYFYRRSGNWKGVSSGGDRYRVPLMYELGAADSYSGYGQIDVTPADGMTAAFFDWRQAAAAIQPIRLIQLASRPRPRSSSYTVRLKTAPAKPAGSSSGARFISASAARS